MHLVAVAEGLHLLREVKAKLGTAEQAEATVVLAAFILL